MCLVLVTRGSRPQPPTTGRSPSSIVDLSTIIVTIVVVLISSVIIITAPEFRVLLSSVVGLRVRCIEDHVDRLVQNLVTLLG